MKIYLVKRKKTNLRWFDNDHDLTNFLINAPESIDSYQIITIDGQVESEMAGDLVLNSIKEQTKLDTKISVALGDEFSQKVNTLIEMYKKLCKKAPWDNTKMSPSANDIYEKIITTPPSEKDFKKIGAGNIKYLIYCVSDSVEWFKVLLDVFPGIKKLNETCDSEYVDPVTHGTRFSGHRTPVKMIKNFEKAKLSK